MPIYLEPALQQRVFPIFHYALEPNGLLLLGSAESVTAASDLFTVVDKRHRIFARRPAAARRLDLELSVGEPHITHRRVVGRPVSITSSMDEVQAEADRVLIARYVPGGVVVNDQLDISAIPRANQRISRAPLGSRQPQVARARAR